MKLTIRIIAGIGLLLVVLAVGWYLCESSVTRIPPKTLTVSAMDETSVRIQMYFDEHNKLPASLEVLPTREGYANHTTDGWRRALIYTQTGPETFTLTSLGRDGVTGGNGDDAEMIQSYQVISGKVTEVH
jgi:hypothetical protein